MGGAFWVAIPMSFIWMALTQQANIEGFIIGYVLGLGILILLREERAKLNPLKIPGQIVAIVTYTVVLLRDIIWSSFDVAWRVLQPQMPLDLGIISVATQDKGENEVIAALSAHAITVTPGQLVVDFEGARNMFVHCLDVADAEESCFEVQQQRLTLLNRIRGGEPENG